MGTSFSSFIVIWSSSVYQILYTQDQYFPNNSLVHLKNTETNLKDKELENEEQDDSDAIGKIDIDDVSDNASISLDLGYGLIYADSSDKKSAGPLISKITGIRKQVSRI